MNDEAPIESEYRNWTDYAEAKLAWQDEKIELLEKSGNPCERCAATGTVGTPRAGFKQCPDCDGIGML